MNFNVFQPNLKGPPISVPFIQNCNNQISFNHTSINYYSPPNFNPQIPNNHYAFHSSQINFPNASLPKTKSVDNLHSLKAEPVVIANHLRISKDDMQTNSFNNQNNVQAYEYNQNDETNFFLRNETPKLEIKMEIPIYYSNNINVINNPRSVNFSDEFLVKRDSNRYKEEDVLSDDIERGYIKSPLVIKINQGKHNDSLLILEKKRKELENLKKQNDLLKSELKKQMELKVRGQLIESLLIENKTMNALLHSKLYQNNEIHKKNNSPLKSIDKSKMINALEIKNQKLKNQLIEEEILHRSKLRLLKKLEEKKNELAFEKEEIRIKEITHHIEMLNQDDNKKVKELIKMMYFKIPELFSQIKQEFQKNI